MSGEAWLPVLSDGHRAVELGAPAISIAERSSSKGSLTWCRSVCGGGPATDQAARAFGSAPWRWPAAATAACAMPLPRTQPLPLPRTQPLQRPQAGRLATGAPLALGAAAGAAGRFGTASSPTPAALLDWYLNRDM